MLSDDATNSPVVKPARTLSVFPAAAARPRAVAAPAPLPETPSPGHPSAGRSPLAAAAADTLLDTLQTSVRSPPVVLSAPVAADNWHPEDDPAQNFCHSGWARARRAVRAALVATFQPPNRIERFERCGSESWVYQSVADPSRLKIVSNHCGDRLCMVCSRIRAMAVQDALRALCATKTRLRFITLTLADTSDGLAPSLDRLYRHFRSLRATDWWSSHVEGGVAFLEVKYSNRARRWHPHFHLIVEGKYMPQAELQALWHGVSGDSFIVDVRACSSGEAAASYAAKYASKPLMHTFSGSPSLMQEAILGLKGRRLFSCFGSWFGTALTAVETGGLTDDETNPQWTSLGSIGDIYHAAKDGHVPSMAIVQRLELYCARRWARESG